MEYSSENPLLSTFTNQMKNSFGCEHDSDRQNQLNEEYFISSNTIMTEKYRDSHIYANIQEMQEESRNRLPPIPPNINEAVRELEHGWREFVTECGRPYFFNIETGICQWKPPRSLAPPSLSSEHLVSASSTNDVSSSPTDGKGFLSATSWTESCIQDAVESLPSRLDETIISCDHSVVSGRNRGDDKQVAGQPFSKELMERVRAFKSNEELAAIEVANLASPSARCSHDIKHSDSSGLFSLGFSKNSIKCGTMEKCKIAEAGQKLKRRDWSSCYIFLSSAHLIFYKDEKSAEKSGKHYEAPLGMCDLRGARLHWVETERDRRKKRPVFQLELIDGTIYHFSASPAENLSDWYLCLREVVSKLPRPDIYPTPVIEREDAGSFVARNSSHFPNSSSALGSSQYRHSTKKAKYDAACSSTVNEKVVTDATPNRETIIEKLKRFFRSRPSIETLKEKGIYRREFLTHT
ncbi:hypothetical protein AB6A40_005180 [Gnathostoma spinigerum]|uniref:PH domain-containing protein n=1 Tax=Gnathostoma spinigerum TaxID=75299 RepID=A0ABD6EFL9_9BILA